MDQQQIGRKLAALRQAKGMTLRDVARKAEALGLQLTPQGLSRLENGLSYPSYESLNTLAVVLDIDIVHTRKGDVRFENHS